MVDTVELPDWLRGTLLLGRAADGSVVPVLIDENGQINILVRGVDGDGTVRTIKVDNTGQLYAVLRGADDVDVAVDASGNLAAILKGLGGDAALHTVAVDNDGQLVMVPRGQSGNYMAVDANGYLTAVLKGIRDSTLTTIAVDADGRIDAFLMDGSDQWGQSLRIGTAELAGRLGSPCTYDWRGQVLWWTDFSAGLGPFYPYLSGTGAAVAIDTEFSQRGGYSAKLTGGSTASRSARIEAIVGRSPAGRLGVAAAISYTCQTVDLILRARPGDTRYIGVLRYAWGTSKLQYLGDDAAYHDIATLYLPGYPYLFNEFKLVIDVDTYTYVRALVNDTEYDLSAYDLESDALHYQGTMEAEVQVISTSGQNQYNYVDRVILTVNEP